MKKTEKKVKKPSKKKDATELVSKLLSQLGFEKAKLSLEEKDEKQWINIEVEDTGRLIGYHGEVLQALQLITNLLLYRKTGEWQKVVLNIGDYWQRRYQQLEQLALDQVQQVKTSGKSAVLPYLSSNERRIIHEFLSDQKEIVTESVGEGKERRLVISPC